MTIEVRNIDDLYVIPKEYKFLLGGIIFGQQPSMKNRNRIVQRQGRTMIIHSKDVYAYSRSFEEQVKNKPEWKIKAGSDTQHLALIVAVYYKTYMSDLSIDLLKDLLQKNETISNDRWVREEHLWAGISKTAPRIHFRLYEIPLGLSVPSFITLTTPNEEGKND